MNDIKYEWDLEKAIANRQKHHIDFADAVDALEDPNRLEEIDDRFDYGEDRMRVLGMAYNRVLFVVTTTRGDNICRIISARRATRDEQTRYFTGDRDEW